MPRAKRQGGAVFRRYHDYTFEKFWRRGYRRSSGHRHNPRPCVAPNASGFASYLFAPACAEHDGICQQAKAAGVFVVPTFVIDCELFWGREHFADIPALLANPSISHSDA
jgi:hypothetical protein